MTRDEIALRYESKMKARVALDHDLLNLRKQYALLSDEEQQFTEDMEEVLVCGRPKKYESHLIGRVHWKETYMDDSDPDNYIVVDRSCAVRKDGEWIHIPDMPIPESATSNNKEGEA